MAQTLKLRDQSNPIFPAEGSKLSRALAGDDVLLAAELRMGLESEVVVHFEDEHINSQGRQLRNLVAEGFKVLIVLEDDDVQAAPFTRLLPRHGLIARQARCDGQQVNHC